MERASLDLSLSLPAERVRPCNLPDVKSPAIVFPTDEYGEPLLVVGRGEESIVCFLGSRHVYGGFPQADAANFKGLAVEGIEFEVELASMYALEGAISVPGSLVRVESSLQLVYRAERGSYPRLRRAFVMDDLIAASEGQQVGFPAWRCVIGVGQQRVEIWRNNAPLTLER